MIANDIIYEGSAVGDNGSGYARPLEAADPFRGFAERNTDNTGGQAGDVSVRVKTVGLIEATISGIALTDVGAAVYMSDDDTFTLEDTSNSLIGKVYRYVGTDTAIVYFNAL